MKIVESSLDGVRIIQPDVFGDSRGYFMETYHQKRYGEWGIDTGFVQDNLSCSVEATLRGLHYQHPHSQVKLVSAPEGEIFDVAVDIRRGSPTFGHWTGVRLTGENKLQMYIPRGFAHGFCVLSKKAFVAYKCSDFYAPDSEGGLLWCDPDLGIKWPVETPLLSEKDSKYPYLRNIPPDRLPVYEGNPFLY